MLRRTGRVRSLISRREDAGAQARFLLRACDAEFAALFDEIVPGATPTGSAAGSWGSCADRADCTDRAGPPAHAEHSARVRSPHCRTGHSCCRASTAGRG
jgi:hypothetical protein